MEIAQYRVLRSPAKSTSDQTALEAQIVNAPDSQGRGFLQEALRNFQRAVFAIAVEPVRILERP